MSVSAYLHLDAPVSSTLLTHYCQQPSHKETFAHFWAKYYKSSNCIGFGKSEYRTAIIFSFQSYPRSSFILGRETRLDLYHIAFIWKLHNMIYDVWWNLYFDLSPWGSSLNEWVVSYGCSVHQFFSVRMFPMIFYSELATLSLNFTLACLCILIS